MNEAILSRWFVTDPWVMSFIGIERSLSSDRSYQLATLFQVDVSTGNNRDNRTAAGLAGKRGCEGQRAGTFRNNAGLFRHQSHRPLCFFEAYYDVIIDQWLPSLPHSREHALATGSIHE